MRHFNRALSLFESRLPKKKGAPKKEKERKRFEKERREDGKERWEKGGPLSIALSTTQSTNSIATPSAKSDLSDPLSTRSSLSSGPTRGNPLHFLSTDLQLVSPVENGDDNNTTILPAHIGEASPLGWFYHLSFIICHAIIRLEIDNVKMIKPPYI